MSKLSLIKDLVKKNPQLSNSDAEDIINIFCKNLENSIFKGQRVELRGFGSFFTKRIKEKYSMRNPKNSQLIYVPEKNKVRFRASKKLKKYINT